jgi:outer membrane protein assembly factor BamD
MSFRSRLSTLLVPMLLTLTATGASLNLTGCAGEAVNENNPASLMRDAEDDISSDHYQVAIEKLRAIKNKFPYSSYAIDAQIRIADVYFMQDSFEDAAAAYESFRDLHPSHPKTEYAMFRIGISYFKDMPGTVARDMASAQKSLEAYEEFLKKYPNSAQAPEARADVSKIRDQLAQKQMYIGDFYLHHKAYPAARHRYEQVLALYPETATAKKAEKKLKEIEGKK